MIRYFYLILILSFLSCEKDDLEEIQWSPIQFVDVDPALSTPAQGSEKQINVVVINYIPTKDKGETLDQYTFPFRSDDGSYDPNLPIGEYKKWIILQS